MKKINYSSKNFFDYKRDLLNYVKQYYPDLEAYFSDGDVGELLLELQAAMGDNLSHHLDRMYQETLVDYAQQRRSLFNLASNRNLKIPGKRPAITVVEVSVTVPVKGDTFDEDYCPVIAPGAQFSGNGRVFENEYEIDFSNPFDLHGTPNRKVIPNINANQVIQNYTITKKEVVRNGATKFYSQIIDQSSSVPFYEVTLGDTDVLGIEEVRLAPGTNYNRTPFEDASIESTLYHQVDSLAQQRVFIADSTDPQRGNWQPVLHKFISEFTPNGYCRLTFGGGSQDFQMLESAARMHGFTIPEKLINQALGTVLPADHTLFVRYRVGGGLSSSVGAGILTEVGAYQMSNRAGDVTQQERTLRVNNPIAAYGGKDAPSNEEIRYMIKYNQQQRERCVTLKDYELQVFKMPGQFGVPFRVNASKEENKVILSVLGIDEQGRLDNQSTSLLKENIASYLSGYRMINDYIEIRDGQVYNLSYDITLFVTRDVNKASLVRDAVAEVRSYFDVNKWQMGEDIYLGQMVEKLNNLPGVTNVLKIEAFNELGQGYSANRYPGASGSGEKLPISLENYTIFGEPDSMFEIRFPNRDIRFTLKQRK